MGFAYDPVKCSRCGVVACKEEATKWLSEHPSCFNCRASKVELLSLSRLEQNVYNGLRASGCTQCEHAPLTAEEFIGHLKNGCKALRIKCPNVCGEEIVRGDAPVHYETCTAKKTVCLDCSNSVLTVNLENHQNSCVPYLRRMISELRVQNESITAENEKLK